MTYTGWILLTASLVGLSCGIVGVFLILRRMAMMADAISHTVAWDRNGFYRHKRIKRTSYADRCDYCRFADSRPRSMVSFRGVQQDASIGVVFTTLFAIGVILIATQVGNAHLDTKHALMGEITFVPWDVMHVPLLGGGTQSYLHAGDRTPRCTDRHPGVL